MSQGPEITTPQPLAPEILNSTENRGISSKLLRMGIRLFFVGRFALILSADAANIRPAVVQAQRAPHTITRDVNKVPDDAVNPVDLTFDRTISQPQPTPDASPTPKPGAYQFTPEDEAKDLADIRTTLSQTLDECKQNPNCKIRYGTYKTDKYIDITQAKVTITIQISTDNTATVISFPNGNSYEGYYVGRAPVEALEGFFEQLSWIMGNSFT